MLENGNTVFIIFIIDFIDLEYYKCIYLQLCVVFLNLFMYIKTLFIKEKSISFEL